MLTDEELADALRAAGVSENSTQFLVARRRDYRLTLARKLGVEPDQVAEGRGSSSE